MNWRHIDSLVIHCSATPDGRWHSTLDIDYWHGQAGFRRAPRTDEARKYNPGLAHIGYHWVIYTNGGLATGRHPSEVGAHARGHNARSLALCLVGTRQYTAAQWSQLRQQVEYLCRRYGVPLQLATADTHWRGICGHRDTGANKACPGFDVAAWLAAGMQPLAEHLLVERRAYP